MQAVGFLLTCFRCHGHQRLRSGDIVPACPHCGHNRFHMARLDPPVPDPPRIETAVWRRAHGLPVDDGQEPLSTFREKNPQIADFKEEVAEPKWVIKQRQADERRRRKNAERRAKQEETLRAKLEEKRRKQRERWQRDRAVFLEARAALEGPGPLADLIVEVDALPPDPGVPVLVQRFKGEEIFGLGATLLPSARLRGRQRYTRRYEGFDDRFGRGQGI